MRGICHICGEEKDLTFEHIPPKVTGNNRRILKISFNDYADSRKGVTSQNGSGANTLCSDCNSFNGVHYVQHYKKWHEAITNAYNNEKCTEKTEILTIDISLDYLKILKQIVSMFLALNHEEAFFKERKEMIKFVKEKDNRHLPSNFGICCYVQNQESKFDRFISFNSMAKVKSSNNHNQGVTIYDHICISEIVSNGIGYIFYLEDSKTKHPKYFNRKTKLLQDITFFKETPLKKIRLKLPIFCTDSFYPSDFRPSKEIKVKEFQKNVEGLSNIVKRKASIDNAAPGENIYLGFENMSWFALDKSAEQSNI